MEWIFSKSKCKGKGKNQEIDYIYGAVESEGVESKWQVTVQMEHVGMYQVKKVVSNGKGEQKAKCKSQMRSQI